MKKATAILLAASLAGCTLLQQLTRRQQERELLQCLAATGLQVPQGRAAQDSLIADLTAEVQNLDKVAAYGLDTAQTKMVKPWLQCVAVWLSKQ